MLLPSLIRSELTPRFTDDSQRVLEGDEVSHAQLGVLQVKVLKPQMDYLQQKDNNRLHHSLFSDPRADRGLLLLFF